MVASSCADLQIPHGTLFNFSSQIALTSCCCSTGVASGALGSFQVVAAGGQILVGHVGPKGRSARLRFQMDAAKEGVVAVQADQVSGEKLGVGVVWWVVSCHTVAAAGGGGLGGGCIWGGVLG